MVLRFSYVVLFGLLLQACAHVPKEAVELSTTVGRDLAIVYQAHRELAQLLFSRMRSDVNRFVDNVYAPFQIRNVMNRQKELAASTNPEDRKKSLLLLIDAAFNTEASPELQETALKAMGLLVTKIHADVDTMRKELLDPLNDQETEVLKSIDQAYQQIHYANSIVTGHLSSVVKVHETQAELLKTIGVERVLRQEVGESLAEASEKIGTIVEAASTADDKLSKAEEQLQKLKNTLSELEKKLIKKRKED